MIGNFTFDPVTLQSSCAPPWPKPRHLAYGGWRKRIRWLWHKQWPISPTPLWRKVTLTLHLNQITPRNQAVIQIQRQVDDQLWKTDRWAAQQVAPLIPPWRRGGLGPQDGFTARPKYTPEGIIAKALHVCMMEKRETRSANQTWIKNSIILFVREFNIIFFAGNRTVDGEENLLHHFVM